MRVRILSGELLIFESNESNVKEKVQDMLEDVLGIFVDLQENINEDGKFELYLHSEAGEDLTEEEFEHLIGLGITEEPETTGTIEKLLGITFKVK